MLTSLYVLTIIIFVYKIHNLLKRKKLCKSMRNCYYDSLHFIFKILNRNLVKKLEIKKIPNSYFISLHYFKYTFIKNELQKKNSMRSLSLIMIPYISYIKSSLDVF